MIEINGTSYIAAGVIAGELGVSRQTMWRWGQEGKIPHGHRFRDGRVLFTQEEASQVREFANRIEPIDPTNPTQPDMFRRSNGGKSK